MAFSKTLMDRMLVAQCDFCFKNITLEPFIKCAECAWDLCFICFFTSPDVGGHRKSHRYRIVSNLTKPLFNDRWRAIDELLLLHGVGTAGIGNFEDITPLIPSKNEREVRRHCFELFGITNNEENEVYDNPVQRSDPNDSTVLSYLPNRGDFESEIFNDYEMTISNMQFTDVDTPLELRLKKDMLRHYRMVMKQRVMWKNYVLDRNLVDIIRLKKVESGELGVVINKYKWLVQYISKSDFNKFIGGLVAELRLRNAKDRRSPEELVDEIKLSNVESMLSPSEKELCRRLCMSHNIYAHLKRLAVECYCARKPLRIPLFKLFAKSETLRIEVLYRWFKSQNIVIADDGARC